MENSSSPALQSMELNPGGGGVSGHNTPFPPLGKAAAPGTAFSVGPAPGTASASSRAPSVPPGHKQHRAPAPSLSFRPAPGGESSSGGSLMAWLTVHAGSSLLSALPGTVGMDAEAAELQAPAPGAVRLPPPL